MDDPARAEHLRRMGCTYGQGYLWGRPMEAAEAERLLGDKVRSAECGVRE